jgi:hypothetical protein
MLFMTAQRYQLFSVPTFLVTIERAMGSLTSVYRPQSRVVWRLLLMLAMLAGLALALGDGGASLQTGALMLAPVLALSILMLTRPYIGERILARIAARRPRRAVAEVRFTAGHSRTSIVRGGRLIAAALAGRAPPPALAGCR